MICLDTNYLILALVPGSAEAARIKGWLEKGEPICMSAVAWFEFLCGPVLEEEIRLAQAILTADVLAFNASTATEAARLFQAVGRKRSLRVDAMIAATATAANADLATNNRNDFKPFLACGLRLT